MTENNKAYFTRRAIEERAAASRAFDERAASAHLEMAVRYDHLAATCDPTKGRLESILNQAA